MRIWRISAAAAVVCTAAFAQTQSAFDNGHVAVSVDAAGSFVLRDAATGLDYARGKAGTPVSEIAETVHPVLGTGKRVDLGTAAGVVRVESFEGCPFVFLQPSRLNSGDAATTVERMETPALRLNLPGASVLKALGTAGLTAPDEHPGSYTFLAIADPATRAGVVIAWVTQDLGNGVVFSGMEDGQVVVHSRVDYGRLEVAAGRTQPGELLAVGYFNDVRLGLEAYADLVKKYYDIKLPPIPSGYCTWYSSPHGGASDETNVAKLAEFARDRLKPYGYDFIQIDDRWQGKPRNMHPLDTSAHGEAYLGYTPGLPLNGHGQWWWGPHSDFTTWDPGGPFRNGMQPTAARIEACGFTPGLWIMPFAWDPTCPALSDHQEWFVKRPDNTLHYAYWAGWSLDMTHPGAREFLGGAVRRIVHDWGFSYLKLDALFAGAGLTQLYVNDGYKEDNLGELDFHDASVTPIAAYRTGLRVVREAAGHDAFILGCNVSQNMRTLGASFGLVDAMRIGPDNGPTFPGITAGPWHGTNRYFLHGRVWYNDPDPVYIRPQIPIAHARLICSWAALSGQLTVFSDWLPGMPEERLEILKRVLPNHGLKPRPVDLLDNDLPRIWLLTDTRDTVRRDVVGLFNWYPEKDAEMTCTSEKIGLPAAKAYVGFDFWANEFIPRFTDALSLPVPAGTARIIAVRPTADHPQVVSVNRHITQGIVSLHNENWNADRQVLSGESRVVGGDAYEVRVVLPDATWHVVDVTADDAKASFTQDGAHVRARLAAPENRNVKWQIRFTR